jgi:hypothetical protein
VRNAAVKRERERERRKKERERERDATLTDSHIVLISVIVKE